MRYEPSADGFGFSMAEIPGYADGVRRLKEARALFCPAVKHSADEHKASVP
jgi:hypothetical protein